MCHQNKKTARPSIGAVLLSFAFSIDHPIWAKGNFLVFRFLRQKGDYISGISPASIQFAADAGDVPSRGGGILSCLSNNRADSQPPVLQNDNRSFGDLRLNF
jgi:hypothetical protein